MWCSEPRQAWWVAHLLRTWYLHSALLLLLIIPKYSLRFPGVKERQPFMNQSRRFPLELASVIQVCLEPTRLCHKSIQQSQKLVNWLEGYVSCLDLWGSFGGGIHSSLSCFLRYGVWRCRHSSVSLVGDQDGQSPSPEGGLLSAEPPQPHEPHRHRVRVCCRHLLSGVSCWLAH